jgi:hypothetical protein
MDFSPPRTVPQAGKILDRVMPDPESSNTYAFRIVTSVAIQASRRTANMRASRLAKRVDRIHRNFPQKEHRFNFEKCLQLSWINLSATSSSRQEYFSLPYS